LTIVINRSNEKTGGARMADKVKIFQDAFQKAISELQTVQNSLGSYKADMKKTIL